jgi:hypothetical protein
METWRDVIEREPGSRWEYYPPVKIISYWKPRKNLENIKELVRKGEGNYAFVRQNTAPNAKGYIVSVDNNLQKMCSSKGHGLHDLADFEPVAPMLFDAGNTTVFVSGNCSTINRNTRNVWNPRESDQFNAEVIIIWYS